MRIADFDYELPEELIAQAPAAEREAARLLVARLGADSFEHRHVHELPELLEPGDLIVVNDTRVRPARLFARRPGGGAAELLLIERLAGSASRWLAMAKPAARLRSGMALELVDRTGQPTEHRARCIDRPRLASGELRPEWEVELVDRTAGDEDELLEAIGSVPLPPYIRRVASDATDRERYQTVFASETGAVAAPTAGLHLSQSLLNELDQRGIERTSVTLHVGPGTFKPVAVEDLAEHHMHSEWFRVTPSTVAAIERARARGGRVIAIGTTSVRALESSLDADGNVAARTGRTELFLKPGDSIRSVDGLLTNFHLPRSTLLMLVAALLGTERTLAAYASAIEARYRFYSYGDAMLIV